MKINDFWKYLGNFWDSYESKDTVEELWGAWAALISDQYLQLNQINRSKNIYTIPIYWKKLWVPFKTDESVLDYDLLDNSYYEDSSVVVDLDTPSSIGFQFLIPGSVHARTEFGDPLDLKLFDIDYWGGFITLLDETVVSSGDQIILEFRVGEGIQGTADVQNKDISYDTENIYIDNGVGFRRGTRNVDYKITYYSGNIQPLTGARAIVQYSYFNLLAEYPHKYPVLDTLHDAAFLYTNTKKEGRFYTRDVDFVIENGFLRFKKKPSEVILWAEEALFNIDNIYRMFGTTVGYVADNSIDYYRSVLALMYFLQHAPTPRNLEGIAHAILGLPVTFGNEEVLDVTIDQSNFNSVTTTSAQYGLGHYSPDVYPGQKLLPIHPLTGVIKIHDRVNSKTFVDLLLYAKILHSDQGYISGPPPPDPQLYADSMFSRSGMHKLFSPWHTFVVEVNDPTLFQDKQKMALLRFVLQNKPAYTTYYMLFSYTFNEFVESGRDRLGIDWHDGYIDGYLGQPFSSIIDGNVVVPDAPGQRLVTAVPHDDVQDYAVVNTTYGNPNIPSTKSRFTGVDTFTDGMYLTPYEYSNVVVYDYNYDIISEDSYTYDTLLHTITFTDPTAYDLVYVKASRKHKVSSVSRDYTDRVVLTAGVGLCFRQTILFDTMYMFGVNMTKGVVNWTVEARSSFIDGNQSSPPWTFNEQIARAYNYGQDFSVDEQTGTLTILPNSRIINGQRIYIDYQFIDFDQHVAYPNTTTTVTIPLDEFTGTLDPEDTTTDDEYQGAREQATVNTTIGVFSQEDVYWDGQIRQDDNDLINFSADIDNPWGFRRDPVPFLPSIMPKVVSEPVHLDYLHTPAIPDDYELFKRQETQRFLELSPSTFLGIDGEAPYAYRYSLPEEDYFVTRLTSVTSEEDLSFGVGGFGISPFGGMPSLKFQIDYLEGRDFVVENVVDARNIKKEIRFKVEPIYTYYYMLRYKPEDFSISSGTELDLGPSNYLDADGEGPYIHRYSLPDPISYLDRLVYKTIDPDAVFGYVLDTDFVVEIWPERVIRFKTQPVAATYYTYEHTYYKYPRMDDILIPINNTPSVYVGDIGYPTVYRYCYNLPIQYDSIEFLWLKTNHRVTKKIDIDFILFYNVATDKVEARFKAIPEIGDYHPYHAVKSDTKVKANASLHEVVKYWDSDNYITHLRWLDTNQDSYVTEREDPADVEIRAARSYVDRSDWDGGHYWCGPGVPIGGRIPAGNTLAPIATSMN